ncbi:DUF3060 domain-containing protein [Arthrobacter sp. NPDC090010]|uniref:DUF3060 domain-containing protein n=1 Tax=Arthrobacter sp. NPDC090010 TaxID=3363942 RepID=UPI0037FFCA9F
MTLTTSRHLTAAATLLVGFALAGCSVPAAQPSGTASPTTESAAGGVREITTDGNCAPGENVAVTAADASAVITGDCGTVSITGANVHANIDSAKKLSVTGAGAAIIGKKWGSVETTAATVSLNADEIAELTVSGADTTVVLSAKAGKASLGGDRGSFNAHDVQDLSIAGAHNGVVLSGKLGALRVSGNDNTVNWSSGVTSPDSDTGIRNSYIR